MFFSLRILAAGAAWRLFGSRRAASLLLDAVAGESEQDRMLAGMSLVKAGNRSLELIEHRVRRGDAPPPVIRLLPDLGGERSRDLLSFVVENETGERADTARECIDLLDRMRAI
jgi:radical SAM superfamily enzyme with C-terminal helix-hairpin-helix motif